MAPRAALLFLTASPAPAAGKGAAGAVSGGGYRSSRAGYYSRSSRYSYYPIFMWHGGYYRGGRHHSRSGASDEAAAVGAARGGDNSIFCARDVRLDYPAYKSSGFGNTVVLNSTRLCYVQKTTTHGALQNVRIEDMYLDVYQWRLSAGSASGNRYPTVEMVQYNDKDDAEPVAQSRWSFSLTKLSEGRRLTSATTDEKGSLEDYEAMHGLDLSEFTWAPSPPTEDPADDDKSGTSVWGFPRQTYLDQAKLTIFSITGTSKSTAGRGRYDGVNVSGNAVVTLSFVLADDFAEDGTEEHVFFRPSSLFVKATVHKYANDNGQYLGIHGFLRTNKDKPVSVGAAPQGKLGTEYDPRKMQRVEVGVKNDEENRGRQLLSWRPNFYNGRLCADACAASRTEADLTATSDCLTSSLPTDAWNGLSHAEAVSQAATDSVVYAADCAVLATAPTSVSCPGSPGAPDLPQTCPLLGETDATQELRRVHWYGQGPIPGSTGTDSPQAVPAAWYLHMGTFDMGESIAAPPLSPAAAPRPINAAAAGLAAAAAAAFYTS